MSKGSRVLADVASHAQQTGMAERLDTAVLARLSDLVPRITYGMGGARQLCGQEAL